MEFHISTIGFLGYIPDSGQVKIDPEKVQALSNRPKSLHYEKPQQFLGFAKVYLSLSEITAM